MSTPNHEQLPAIAHQGGLLLKAGAGSGKTYVLVEHAIHLTREWRAEWEKHRSESFVDFIAQKFSSTVLMTFTRLAAGEILVRLTLRFQKQVHDETGSEKAWWQEALSQIDRLHVTTIDGFFYKLVRKGFFKQLPPDVEIIMDGPRKKRIITLFDRWWSQKNSQLNSDVSRDIVMHRQAMADTLLEIFNDPTLRESWMNFSPTDAHPTRIEWLATLVPEVEGWNNYLSLGQVEIPKSARDKNNKWVALADALNARNKKIESWSDILSWADFIKTEVGQTKLSLGTSKELVGYYFDEWRVFKGSVLEWAESYSLYSLNFESRILPWLKSLHSLVHYINSKLSISEGITYGDLEFHVLQGLKAKSAVQKIQNEFSYFVVDEFQDTSRIQYEILKLIAGSSPNKLFCIGDAKQAIYGFRGGELKVFKDVEETNGIITRILRSNYRSLKSVVRFNNDFFEKLFPLGIGWDGHDPHAVIMEKQETLSTAQEGCVQIIEGVLPDMTNVDESQSAKKVPKWRSAYLKKAESLIIAESIQQDLISDPDAIVAVLYKKLAPSRELMRELMMRDIGFTAQAKIPFKDDPLSGILLSLIEDHLAAKEGSWSKFLISGYLHLLGIPHPENLGTDIKVFLNDVKLYGAQIAYDLFLSRLGIANSLFESLNEIREMIKIADGNLEAILLQLKSRSSESWSADFRFGKRSDRVIIQTSHGSKGLEYDIVYVGGLATNGKSKNNQDWIGSLPGAALWVENASSRKRVQTPQLVFEKALKKQKEFAESKRLFYVACTRAKNQLKLVRLIGEESQIAIDKNSWAAGLEAYLERSVEKTYSTIRREIAATDLRSESSDRPFFHDNPLGLSKKAGVSNFIFHGVSSELSVTALNSLIDCPRKFYYKQILKISEESIEEEIGDEWGGEREILPLSSSERGSAIHLGLSQAIIANFVLPREWVNHADKQKMEWVLQEIKNNCTQDSRFISEQALKFPVFGYMISGIPDLVVYSKATQIWDFKTGRRSESGEIKYWLQLKTYALALWSLGLIPLERQIDLRLCYLDSSELPVQSVCFDQVKDEIFGLWKKLGELDQVNLGHCEICPYKSICPR